MPVFRLFLVCHQGNVDMVPRLGSVDLFHDGPELACFSIFCKFTLPEAPDEQRLQIYVNFCSQVFRSDCRSSPSASCAFPVPFHPCFISVLRQSGMPCNAGGARCSEGRRSYQPSLNFFNMFSISVRMFMLSRSDSR